MFRESKHTMLAVSLQVWAFVNMFSLRQYFSQEGRTWHRSNEFSHGGKAPSCIWVLVFNEIKQTLLLNLFFSILRMPLCWSCGCRHQWYLILISTKFFFCCWVKILATSKSTIISKGVGSQCTKSIYVNNCRLSERQTLLSHTGIMSDIHFIK